MSTPIDFTIQHSSMEFSDTGKQKREDADSVLSTGNPVVMGTEAGKGAGILSYALRLSARRHGYYFYRPRSAANWIAIKKDFVVSRPTFGYQKVLDGSAKRKDPNGPYGERGIVWATFKHPNLVTCTVGTGHFITKGRTRSQTPSGRNNHFDMNTHYIKTVAAWARIKGGASKIVFFSADSNIPDKEFDVFRGEPMTTCWDELHKYVDSGHGSIDIIASYDRDKRVKCVDAKVLNLGLNSDHKTVQATYEVTKLK